MNCKKIIASGRVQGVYYRASLQRKANELGLKGYVQNLPDKTVEAIVIGPEDAVAALVKWCWDGPPMAAVTKIKVSEVESQEDFSTFDIRR